MRLGSKRSASKRTVSRGHGTGKETGGHGQEDRYRRTGTEEQVQKNRYRRTGTEGHAVNRHREPEGRKQKDREQEQIKNLSALSLYLNYFISSTIRSF